MPKNKKSPIQIPSARSEDHPASRLMLSLVRDELVQKIESVKTDVQAVKTDVQALKADVQEIKADMQGFRTETLSLRGEFQLLRSDFQRLEAGQTRMHFLLEEQNANNRIVLEGLQALWQRQSQIEALIHSSQDV